MASVASIQLAPVLDRLGESGASYDTKKLGEAFAVAQSSFSDAPHWTGESIINHTLGILEELAPFEPDEDTVLACLLHHVLEQKVMTLVELEQQFGPKVRSLVSGIHLLSHITLEGRRRSIEDLRIMLLSVSDDIRVLLVCLCDRAHCLKCVGTMDAAQAKRLSQDVLQLFAPVAARLGIYSLKQSLETAAFPVVYEHDSERIVEQLNRVYQEHPNFLQESCKTLQDFLEDQGIDAAVDSREKQAFSIFQKMRRKSLTNIEDIYDLFALRVIVNSEEDCYRVLGLLHQLGRPLANRFKDYIAFPKPNGYQSLHTTLAGFADLPQNCMMEVQVRTSKMHREAQFGVAAHWSYKEVGATARALEKVQLHSMLAGQEPVDDEQEGQTFADHIFVLTPRGDIVELPEGATPLDFAFKVHTDLGLLFRSANVNGSIVSLDYQLKNGDVIEIQKHSSPQPSTQWMQMLRMASSRSKLRRYLYAQERPHLISEGRDLVNAQLKKRGLPPLTTDLSVLRVCDGETLGFTQREDLLMKIGQGAERVSSLPGRLGLISKKEIMIDTQQKKAEPSKIIHSKSTAIGIDGGISMPIQYAKCCGPQEWPHASLVGNINREGKVMIHRDHCRMFQNTNPERRIKVWWK
jgi:GTP pyrophosphokinase